MRPFVAFFKKELLESLRSGKLLLAAILFCAFGLMNPAIAKLTPRMLELLSEELAENGMTVAAVEVNALTSWTQFFKNIPMALIAFVLVYGGIFTKEYESGTLILLLTKGLPRDRVVLAKSSWMLLLWSAGYWTCFGITYAYNAYFWDNAIASDLGAAAVNWWLFGVLTVSLIVLFSVILKSAGGALLGVGGTVLLMYVLSMIPRVGRYLPISLTEGMAILSGVQTSSDCTAAILITAFASLGCIAVSIPIFNRREL